MRPRTHLSLRLSFLTEKRHDLAGDYLIPADRVHQQRHHCVSSIIASIVATDDSIVASVPRMHAEPVDQPAESTLPDVRPLFSGSDREHKGIKDRIWFREKYIRAEQV